MNLLKIFLLSLFFIFFHCFADEFTHIFQYGMEYNFFMINQPRPIRIYVLKIDIKKGKVKPIVICAKDPDGNGPVEAVLTNPLELIKGKDVIAFINTNPWDSFPNKKGKKNTNWYVGQYVDILGLVASKGIIISPPGKNTSVWTDKTGKFHISEIPDMAEILEGVAGWYQIVKKGDIIPKQNNILNPLTAIGIDQTGYLIWFVVVDGRQKGFSEGMTHYELAEFMINLGCFEAALMDGGGSSIMGIIDKNGRMRIVNSPSDKILWIHRIRPLPVILAITKN